MRLKLLIVLILGWMVVSSAKSAPQHLLQPRNGKHAPIIKIEHNVKLTTCTAFVVADELAITAAHCTIAWPLDPVIPETFQVYTSTGENTYIMAQSFGPRKHVDILFLKGNFREFNKIPLDVKEFTLRKGDDLYLCGYSGGYAPPVCNVGEYLGSKDFMGTTDGYVAKGMSGGPVINRDGRAVGVNSSKEGAVSTFGVLFGNIKTSK